MGVSKCLVLTLFVLSNICFSAELYEGANSIEYVRSKARSSAEELEAAIIKCTEIRQNSLPPKISEIILINSEIDRKSLVQGLAYLSNRNFAICEGNSRMEIAYHLGTLKSLVDHHNVEISGIDDIKNALIYPTYQDIQAELAFNSLPKHIKRHLLQAVGNSPFELLKTISANNIFGK